MDYIINGMQMFFGDPIMIIVLAGSVFIGIYVGAIPGLSASMACSLLVSFTFTWRVETAMAAMLGIQIGTVYGGSRSAILLNIPGAPAAVATSFDGYQLAQKGRAAESIGVTVIQSFYGGLIGAVILSIAAPIIGNFALRITPRDYFLLGIMGLMLVGSLGNETNSRGIFAAAFGLFLGCIGMCEMTGAARFTFGNIYLLSGLNYVVVMLGLFGMSEALVQLRNVNAAPIKQKVGNLRPDFKNSLKYALLTIRCSLIGVFVGALPGTGGDIASLMAYDHAKRTTKNPEVPFGEGAIEGLVAPESANNAAIGGAYIPMLTLGIPGDGVTAILIGALMIHGLRPGPLFMVESPEIFSMAVAGNFIGNIFLLIFGFMGIKMFAKIVEVPRYILMPVIIILSTIGAFSINNNIADIYWMLIFGIIGYFFKNYNIPVGPVILGVILRPLIESNFRRGITLTDNNLLMFIVDMFKNPVSLVIILIIILMVVSQRNIGKSEDSKSESI